MINEPLLGQQKGSGSGERWMGHRNVASLLLATKTPHQTQTCLDHPANGATTGVWACASGGRTIGCERVCGRELSSQAKKIKKKKILIMKTYNTGVWACRRASLCEQAVSVCVHLCRRTRVGTCPGHPEFPHEIVPGGAVRGRWRVRLA